MLISFFISPTFATEINDPATCDSGTLSTDTGPTNLRANYESNTLNLKWYDDNGNQLNVQNESNSCTYGGVIIPPTPPTKRGYTFKGWKVVYDLRDLDASINYTSWGDKAIDGATSGSQSTWNTSEYGLTENGTWGQTFSYGKITGRALCSVTSGSNFQAGTPDESSDGEYCWCRVVGYQPNDSTIVYTPVVAPWVLHGNRSSTNLCQKVCAYNCATSASYIRRPMFGN